MGIQNIYLRNGVKVAIFISLLVISSFSIYGYRYFENISKELPKEIQLLKRLANESVIGYGTEVYDRQGNKIGNIEKEKRYYLSYEKIPEHVRLAFLSAEDNDFFQHNGVDYTSILRALIANFKKGQIVQGASTITQQLARMYFLSNEKSYTRKIKEIILARLIERKLTKQEILELYLNKVFLGNRSYGVEAASKNYFGKSASQLTIGEAALLASLPKAPSKLALNRNLSLALNRQKLILKQMLENGYISDEISQKSLQETITVKKDNYSKKYGRHFLGEIRNIVQRMFEFDSIETQGLKIYTTLDLQMQKTAEIHFSDFYKRYRLDKREIQAGLVSLGQNNGAVRAMLGSFDFNVSQYNRTIKTKRTLGGMFIPFIIAAAIDQGYNLASPVDVEEATLYAVKDLNHPFPSLYEVLMNKKIEYSVVLLAAMGLEKFGSVIDHLGFKFSFFDLRLGLGLGEESLLGLSQAYSSLTNGGRKSQPYFIERIEDIKGQVIFQKRESFRKKVFANETTAQILNLSIENITSKNKALKGPVNFEGIYSSVNEDNKDSWYIGVNRNIITSLWLGSERGKYEISESKEQTEKLLYNLTKTFLINSEFKSHDVSPDNFQLNEIAYSKFEYLDENGQIVKEFIPFAIGSGPTGNIKY